MTKFPSYVEDKEVKAFCTYPILSYYYEGKYILFLCAEEVLVLLDE